MSTIKLKSQVRLKSGGPEMTVTSSMKNADGTEFVTCKWQDNENQLNMADFSVEALDVIT